MEQGNPLRVSSALPRFGMCPCWEQDRNSPGCFTFPSSTSPKESQFCPVMSPLNSCTASKGSQCWRGVDCSLCFSFPPCSQTSILFLAIQTVTKPPKAFSQPSPPNKPHTRMPQGARKTLKSSWENFSVTFPPLSCLNYASKKQQHKKDNLLLLHVHLKLKPIKSCR